MNKVHHYLNTIIHRIKKLTLTTPVAILLGSVIIAISIVVYGVITKNNTDVSKIADPLPKILKSLKINKKDFTSCVNSGELASSVTLSAQDGAQAGVNGTPSTFILKEQGGVQYVIATISGARDYSFFKTAIDQALSSENISGLPRFTGKPAKADEVEGEASTGVSVIEYSDAECPFCISLHNTMKQIRADYSGKISFAYRNFPLTNIHQHAQKEAEMIACSGKLGGAEAYYGFIDDIFDFKIKNNISYIPYES